MAGRPAHWSNTLHRHVTDATTATDPADVIYLGGIPHSGADLAEIAEALGARAGELVDSGRGDYTRAARLQALYADLFASHQRRS
jgi:hypothetical protein